MTSAVTHRRDLASALAVGGAVRSLWLRRAFEETPREMFVLRFYRSESGREVLVDGTDPRQHEKWLRGVYTDEVLTVQLTPAPDLANGAGAPTSSSSMPAVMAGMLEALDLQPDHCILEIGTGTGYNTALLCHRVGAQNVVSVELDPALADAARRALAGLGLSPAVHVGDGAAGLAAAAPFDRIIATAATDHMRTRLDSPLRNGESWDQVFDQRNPQRGTTPINPGLVADNPSLRFMAQLHLTGHRLRGFLRPFSGGELTGRCTDGSWFTASLQPDDNGLFPVAQGGPQRLWDTVESCYAAWRRLGEPNVEQFGATAYLDAALQYIWFDHPDSQYRWPLPL